MKSLLQALAFVACIFALNPAFALPQEHPFPGGIVHLDIGPVAPEYKLPEVYYKGYKVFVSAVDGKWKALIGIPLDAAPGQHQATLISGNRRQTLAFSVLEKTYPEQRLKIKDKGKVNLSSRNLKRVKKEKTEIRKVKTYWRKNADVDLQFNPPVNARLSSRFGLKRFYNGQPRSPHSGLDFAAPAGTAIKSPARGKVLAIANYFFTGNTVFVDHGSGLISLYAHLSKINVYPGDELETGDKLGEIGSSGRATGPHLHWSIYLNGTAVNPELFLTVKKSSSKIFIN